MAFDAYLSFEPKVEGESTREGFAGAIEIYSFSFGASNPSTIGTGSAGAGAGKASLSSMNIMKMTDTSSAPLFQACCMGTHYDKAKVVLHKAAGDTPLDYLVYEFEHVYIDSIQWSGSSGGDDRPTESLSMSFGKVTITYTPQDAKGNKGKPIVASWNVQTNTK